MRITQLRMYDAAYPGQGTGYADRRLGTCFRRPWSSASRMSSFLKAAREYYPTTTQPPSLKGAMMTAHYIANTALTLRLSYSRPTIRLRRSQILSTVVLPVLLTMIVILTSRSTLVTRHHWKSYLSRTKLRSSILSPRKDAKG